MPKNNGLAQAIGAAGGRPHAAAAAGAIADLSEHRGLAERRQRFRLKRHAGRLLPFERVRECHRTVTGGRVDLLQDRDSGCVHYRGVITCGSRWHCAVCAAKKTEADRRELQRAMALWNQHGGKCYLATFTFPHDVTLPLDSSLAKMQKAQSRMKGWSAYKEIMERAGACAPHGGSVKALECTYGVNGWHPHVHMVLFARAEMLDVLEEIRPLWAKAVEKVGLGKVNEHGFRVHAGDHAAEYVAKFGKEATDETKKVVRAWWSMSQEVTKGHTKDTRRLDGATPFTLLRLGDENGDRRADELFVEYAHAFKGRAQLFWSPGLKKRIDLLELREPKAQRELRLLASLDFADFHAVLRNDALAELQYIAERGGAEAVAALLERLRRSRGNHRGDFKARDPTSGAWYPGYWKPPEFERVAA